MIRISKLTDYGVLIMSHMTQTPAAVMSASDLAASLHLPLPTVSKVLKSLSQAGLLSSRRGIAGAPDRPCILDSRGCRREPQVPSAPG